MLIKIAKLLGLIAVAIWATYFGGDLIATAFYLATFVAYYMSKNEEPFWLTFFFVLSDGFIGFFNNYEAVITAIPGLPPVEVGHFYIVLTAVKVFQKKSDNKPFYDQVLAILGIYVLFLVVQGYVLGVTPELNVHFRIIKFILPLLLFYTIPRLFDREEQYREMFALFIPFAFIALLSQVITIATGVPPSQFLGVYQNLWFLSTAEAGKTYRGFYSTVMVLMSFFGAMYYTAVKSPHFNKTLLFSVMAADFLSAFLSATRGWILCFSLAIFFHLVFVLKLSARRVIAVVFSSSLVALGLTSIPVVKKQFTNAFERVLTLEALAGGDVTAGGTLQRLNERLPRVINKWEESPLTGWGFSDDFFKYGDFHVGNHNILLQAGIAGAVLMLVFLGYFFVQLFQRGWTLSRSNPYKNALLVFPIFFMGWFVIHSSSGQQFAFYADPVNAIAQVIFFSFGALMFKDAPRYDE